MTHDFFSDFQTFQSISYDLFPIGERHLVVKQDKKTEFQLFLVIARHLRPISDRFEVMTHDQNSTETMGKLLSVRQDVVA